MAEPTATVTEAIKPTTTAEEQVHSASQRNVNLIWERTQQVIAIGTVIAFLLSFFLHIENTALSTAFFLIVGFYFGRTNHQIVGGVQQGR